MEQNFDSPIFQRFQRSVCPSTAQANKGGEVTHFVVRIRYGLFSIYAFFTRATEKLKSFILVQITLTNTH
jgi:hypothetical protein